MTTPELTIIVPTFNRSEHLLSTVEQVLAQDFDDFELLIPDQSEPAIQVAHARAFSQGALADPRVTHFSLTVRGVANARNHGIGRARGRVILFLDDDVILLSKSFLRAHLENYADPRVGGVGGRVVERLIRQNTHRTESRVTPGGRTVESLLGTEPCRLDSLKGANMSLRTEIFRHIGGYDRRYSGTALLEEADVAARAVARGWQLRYEPRAELLHLSAPAGGVRAKDDDRREWYRFRSTAYFIRKNRGPRGLPPFLATFALIALARTARRRDPRVLLSLTQAAWEGLATAALAPDQGIEWVEEAQGGTGASAPPLRSTIEA
ncbi:glycosyltransferase family 2 protein [Roseomonas sp. GCM10028921]